MPSFLDRLSVRYGKLAEVAQSATAWPTAKSNPVAIPISSGMRPCEVERVGTLYCAVGSKWLAKITECARQWRERNATIDEFDASETERKVGSKAYSGSLLDRRAGIFNQSPTCGGAPGRPSRLVLACSPTASSSRQRRSSASGSFERTPVPCGPSGDRGHQRSRDRRCGPFDFEEWRMMLRFRGAGTLDSVSLAVVPILVTGVGSGNFETDSALAGVSARRADTMAADVDMMPVGTARHVDRTKHTRRSMS